MWSRSKSARFALPLFLSLAGIAASPSAHAVEMCVNSVALLQSALLFGQFQPDEPLKIKLVQGTYAMPADMAAELAAPAVIEGGYVAGCGSREPNADNTILDFASQSGVSLHQNQASPEASLVLDGITFRNLGHVASFRAGDTLTNAPDHDGSLTLRRVRFSHVAVSAATALSLQAVQGALTLENVLIDHVSSSSTCAVSFTVTGGAPLYVNHMTAELPGNKNLCLDDSGDATVMQIHNSILWGAGGISIFSGGLDEFTQVRLVNDVFDHAFTLGEQAIVAQISTAPGFVNAAAGNYRLATNPVSPAINSGALVTPLGEPDTDIEGHLRVAGLFPDRGAYESSVSNQTTLAVTNTNDNGIGSLRQAMIEANATADAKAITFNIRDNNNVPVCPAVIALSTPLPKIEVPMSINAGTQPLSSVNTSLSAFNAHVCVVIKPASGTLAYGFNVSPPATQASLTLRGVGLGGFGQPLMLLGGHDHVIVGNQFGGTVLGVALPGASLNAIALGVAASGSAQIGGTLLADRNVIGDAEFAGINIQSDVASSTDRCQINNNLIGLAPNGSAALPNNVGINASGGGCLIVRNRIAGNTATQLWLNGSEQHVVQQNIIGLNAQNLPIANLAVGILVSGGADGNIVGASASGGGSTSNTISYMGHGGVVVEGASTNSNSFNANRIDRNGVTEDGMDIDLVGSDAINGPTANDVGDSDTGGNRLQNFPTLTGITYFAPLPNGTREVALAGTLASSPGTYRVDAYFSSTKHPSNGRGHMQTWLGRGSVTVASNGNGTFSLPTTMQTATGFVSFTATDSAGNTSEVGVAAAVNQQLFSDEFEDD